MYCKLLILIKFIQQRIEAMFKINQSKFAKGLRFRRNQQMTQSGNTKQTNQLKGSVSQILRQINTIDSKMKQVIHLTKKNQYKLDRYIYENSESKQQGQLRFGQITFPFQDINEMYNQQRLRNIKVFCSDLSRKTLSKAFAWFQQGKFTNQKFRYYFCNNFISNIVRYSHFNKLTEEELKQMDRHLKQKVFLFLQERYPQNQSSYSNSKFNDMIHLIDNLQSNDNDLVYKSGIKFEYKKSGDYNKQIMQFINYLLKLTRQGKFFNSYYNLMEEIYQKVQNQDWMIMALKNNFQQNLDRSRMEKKTSTQAQSLQQANRQANNNKQKYKQRVKQYTKYEICQKISKGFSSFSEKDLIQQNLKIEDAGVMRILSKWCVQLQQCFNEINIRSRDERFRMTDGSERYMKQDRRRQLYQEISMQKKKLDEFVNQARNNIYQNQKKMLEDGKFFSFFRDFASQGEAITGYFATVMKKCYQNYLISYLNKLIHCILTAQQNLKRKYEKKTQYKTQINLISFHVGDLFRSRFQSKQSQVIAIYSYLLDYCSKNKNKLQIVRVKNRLSETTKDILINFKFDNKIIVQMQLLINDQNSTFGKCSSQAKHFLYQVNRAKFGPIAEICNIYSIVDPRARFFESHFSQFNNRHSLRRTKSSIQQCRHTKIQTSLPAWCTDCQKFNSSLNFVTKNIKCLQCKISNCSTCLVLRSKLKDIQDRQIQLKFEDLIKPQKGLIRKNIHILDMEKKIQTQNEIYIIYYNTKLLFFERQKKQLFLIGEAKNQEELENILHNKYILSEQSVAQQQEKEVEKNIYNQIIKNLISRANKKMKKLFIFEKATIDDSIFLQQNLETVQKLIMSKVQLKCIKNIVPAFKNVKIALINKNHISDLSRIEQWKYVQELNLQSNHLSQIPQQICKLQNLNNLVLTKNRFIQFPKQICNIKNLRLLNFKQNQLPQISRDIKKLVNLEKLRLNKNKISEIPAEIGELHNLQQLNMEFNYLTRIPIQINKLKMLKNVSFQNNKIKQIQNDLFAGLQNLSKVDLSYNQIQKIPTSLIQHNNIVSLDLGYNQIKEINIALLLQPLMEEVFLQFNQISTIQVDGSQNLINQAVSGYKFKKVQLNNNKLQTIPQQFFNITLIENLNLGHNPLILKENLINRLKNLKYISLQNLSLTNLPKDVMELPELEYLNLNHNRIQQLPKQIQQLKKLNYLSICENCFKTIPEQLFTLKRLQNLNLNQNEIQEVPNQIAELKSLKVFRIKQNKIRNISSQLIQTGFLGELHQFQIQQNLKAIVHVIKSQKSIKK